MKTRTLYLALVAAVCLATMALIKPAPKDYEREIYAVESAFQKMTVEKGIAEAFWFYADEHAVLKRQDDTLIKGRMDILKYYAGQDLKNASVQWSPDVVSVSQSGDMAYTYGKYVWTIGSGSSKKEIKGVFHTVWKRQKDGSWKYVWD